MRDNIVQWSFRSENFPKVPNNFKRGESVPPTTVAGEAFLKSNARYTTVEAVDFEDWFIYKNWKPEWQLYEQCFYSDQYNSVRIKYYSVKYLEVLKILSQHSTSSDIGRELH
jgi:hypothetical protein